MRGRGVRGGTHEDRAAGGDFQKVVLDEVATGLPIPDPGEGHGLHDASGDERKRPLRANERKKRTHELIVQSRRRPAHDVLGGPSLNCRSVCRHQPR